MALATTVPTPITPATRPATPNPASMVSSSMIMTGPPAHSDASSSTITRITQDGRKLTYRLTVIQQPERARACGSGAKAAADRRPIDPPPIVALSILEGDAMTDVTFSYNANFFLFVMLDAARPIAQGRVPQTPSTFAVLNGSFVSGASYLDRPEPAAYFLFQDLSVRHEGRYRLSFSLYEGTKDAKDMAPGPSAAVSMKMAPNAPRMYVHWRLDVKSKPFTVYSAKKFPGLAESTVLSRIVAEQGCRVRIRRDVRMRRRETKAESAPSMAGDEDDDLAGRDRASASPDVPATAPAPPLATSSAPPPAGDGLALPAHDRPAVYAHPYAAPPTAPPPTEGYALLTYAHAMSAAYPAPPPPPPSSSYALPPSSSTALPTPTSASPRGAMTYSAHALPAPPPPSASSSVSSHAPASVSARRESSAAYATPSPSGAVPTPTFRRPLPPLQTTGPPPDGKSVSLTSPGVEAPSHTVDGYTSYAGPPAPAPSSAAPSAADPTRAGKRPYGAVFNASQHDGALRHGMRPAETDGAEPDRADSDVSDDDALGAFPPRLPMTYKRADGSSVRVRW